MGFYHLTPSESTAVNGRLERKAPPPLPAFGTRITTGE